MLTNNITEVSDSFYKKHILLLFFFFWCRMEWGKYVLVFIVVQFYHGSNYFTCFKLFLYINILPYSNSKENWVQNETTDGFWIFTSIWVYPKFLNQEIKKRGTHTLTHPKIFISLSSSRFKNFLFLLKLQWSFHVHQKGINSCLCTRAWLHT